MAPLQDDFEKELLKLQSEAAGLDEHLREAIRHGGDGEKIAVLKGRADALPALIGIAELNLLQARIGDWEARLPELQEAARGARQQTIAALEKVKADQQAYGQAARLSTRAAGEAQKVSTQIRRAKERLEELAAEIEGVVPTTQKRARWLPRP